MKGMRIKECSVIFFKEILIPLIAIAVVLCFAYPICHKAEGMDYFLLWLIVGFPFGIRRMMLWLIPHNYGISGIGGIIGGFVVIYMIGRSIVALVRIIITIAFG